MSRKRRLLPALLTGLVAVPASAATFTVDRFDVDFIDANPGDCSCATAGGDCTLRAAVMEANACAGTDTIHFANAALDQVIVLNRVGAGGADVGDLNITEDLNILGWWSGAILPPEDADRLPMIDAAVLGDRIFSVHLGVSADLRGLQLRNGSATVGGAIRNRGTLSLRTSRLLSNSAAQGGAIANAAGATLTVQDTDFVLNEASDEGAAIHNLATATFRRSSFRDNRHTGAFRMMIHTGPDSSLVVEDSIISGAEEAAGNNGSGGIHAIDPALLELRNSSLVDFNLAGAALWLQGMDGSGTVRVANSILSNEHGQVACLLETGGDAGDVVFDHSLIRQGVAFNGFPCEPYFGPDVIDGPAPSLMPFAQNPRQLTRYRMAWLASGLRDAGNPDALDPDPALRCTSSGQNGVMRPQDGDADGSPRCDLGAAEASSTSAVTFIVDSPLEGVDDVPGDGVCATVSATCTLRAGVMEANAKPGPDRIEFAPGTNLAQLFLAGAGGAEQGDLDITEQVTISGNLEHGRPATTVLGLPGLGDRLFHVHLPPGETVRLENLVLSGGRAPDFQNGGALVLTSESTVSIERVVATDNTAGMGGNGGAFALSNGELMVRDSDLYKNAAGGQGAAIYVAPSARLVVEDASIRLHGEASLLPNLKAAVRLNGGEALLRQVTLAGNELALYATGDFDLSLQNSSFALNEDVAGEHFVWGVAHHLLLDGGPGAHFQAIANAFEDGGLCEVQLDPGAVQDSAHHNLSEAGCAPALGLVGNLIDYADFHYRTTPAAGRVGRVLYPRPGSPLVDRVPTDALNCPAQDARGAARPVNASGQVAALCDVGAVELSAAEFVPQPLVVNVYDVDLPDAATCNRVCDADETEPGEQCTLRAAVMESNCAWVEQDWTSEIVIPQAGVTIPLDLPPAGDGSGGTLRFGHPAYARRIVGPDVSGDARPLLLASHGKGVIDNSGNDSSLELANLRITGGDELPGIGGGVSHGGGGTLGPLYLRNVELFGNQASQGGAIYAGAETLLERVSIHGNAASDYGAAIQKQASGPLTIVDSSIRGNTVLDPGSRAAVRYEDPSDGGLVVANTTISSNNGAGLEIHQANAEGNTYLLESTTIVGNQGSGILISGNSPWVRTLVLRHSALVDNGGGGCVHGAWNGVLDTIGHNLSQDDGCGMAGGSNLIGVDALLGPLQTPANATAFHAPLPGSPLIDGGSPEAAACPDTDQLGNPRPQDGDGDGIARCNIGAIEAGSVPTPPPPPMVDGIFGSGFED